MIYFGIPNLKLGTEKKIISVFFIRYEEAYRDATQILKDDSTNKAIQPYLQRLYKIVEERARINAQTNTKLESMLKIVFDPSNDKEKRETAMKNLLVLARENAGSEIMVKKSPIVQKLKNLLKMEKNQVLYVTGVRIIGELCKHSEDKTKTVLKDVGVPWFLEILDSNNEEIVNAAQYCLQSILNTLSGTIFHSTKNRILSTFLYFLQVWKISQTQNPNRNLLKRTNQLLIPYLPV